MMAQVMVLLAGLLLLAESQASDVADRSTHQDFRSKRDYDKFITPNLNRMKHGNELGASPFTVVDDKPILQSSTQVQNSSDPISLSIFGIGLVSFVTMLGLSLWRALQPATIPTNTVSALGGQVMEMKAQDSNVKANSGRVGWDPLDLLPSDPRLQPAVFAIDEDALKNQILNAGPAEFNKIGGIEEEAMEIPEGTSFEPPVAAKVMGRYDGEYELTVSESEITAGAAQSVAVSVTPDSMTIEDFYAGFADAPEWISVSPNAGRLDRKGGEPTVLTVTANPPEGASYDGDITLVAVLPDDIDKAYKVSLKVGAGVATSDFDAGSDADMG